MEQIKVDITKEFIKVVLEYYNNVYLAENKIFKHKKDMNYFKKELGIDNNYTIYNNGRQ